MNRGGIPIVLSAIGTLILLSAVPSPGFADTKTNAVDQAQQPSEQSAATTSSAKDAHALEKETAKRQLINSPPANAKLPPAMPAGGKIIVTPEQKKEAANEAVKIDDADYAPTIPAQVSGRNTVALALGGGGARGAAHIGVIRALLENHIPIDYVVGNSMGAIVGGLFAAGVPLDNIHEMLASGELRHAYMPGPLPPKVLISPMSKLVHIGAPDHYAGLFSGKKFTKFVEAHLPNPAMDVKDTKTPFSAVATNLLDGKAYRISDGRLSTALKASSAITPLLQPVAIKNKVYVDGGVRANLPASAARQTGAGMVIAVLVDEPLRPVPAKRFMHLKWIAGRMADIVLATADERQLQFADVIVNPDVSGIPILSKNPSDVEKAEEAGYRATIKALPQIRKVLLEPPHMHSSVAAGSGATTQ